MLGDEAEAIAWDASRDSGLDDRPRCDPAVLAVCYLGLRLCPIVRAEPCVVGDRLIYPPDEDPAAVAYLQAHECGHELALDAGVPPEHEEQIASRIGVAFLLPRPRYIRDMRLRGWDLVALRDAWPLATLWIHARRIAEVTDGAIASRWSRKGALSARVVTEGIAAPSGVTTVERALARAAMQGETAAVGPRLRAWPEPGGGAIVVCSVEDLADQLARVDDGRARRARRRY